LEKLEVYYDLLVKWQRSINLVSRGTLDDFWTRHIWDSLQIGKYIKGTRLLDIGSGGGFPGMVLAICENFDVTCIDSDNRKIIFLEEVARLTETKVTLNRIRIENFNDCRFDTVCARGFSALTSLMALAKKHSGYGVFLKGRKVKSEILDAQKLYDFKYNIFKSETDDLGNIITISDIFPRKHE
jgi:16S rRNA (guanine527-N7)-methyltransferase